MKTWKDINIRKGKEIYDLESDPFYNENQIEKLTQQLCIILDKDEEWVNSIPLSDLNKYKEEIGFLSEPPKTTFNKEIVIDGESYHFINFNKLSFGEWIDLDSFSKDPVNNLEKIITIIYRKKDEKYHSDLIEERSNLFLENMDYETASGAALFFSLLGMDTIKVTPEYTMLQLTMMEMMKMYQKEKERLLQLEPKKKKKRGVRSNGG